MRELPYRPYFNLLAEDWFNEEYDDTDGLFCDMFDGTEYIEDWDEMYYLLKMFGDVRKIDLTDYPACNANLYEYLNNGFYED